MRSIKLIVSDLHVGDGDLLLDGFGERQQAALEGLLSLAGQNVAGNLLGEAEDVELIINGDCLDFQLAGLRNSGGMIDAGEAVEKLGRMMAAHGPFFEVLGTFARQPGRRVTFMTGNHDIQLCFAEVRAGIVQALGLQPDDERVYFCLTRSYRPLLDVHIEHGNAYDFWNHDRSGYWDASGHVKTDHPQVMTVPMDEQYLQHAGLPFVARFPYLMLFEPMLSIPRQAALFSLLHPEMIMEYIQHVQELLDAGTSGTRQRSPSLSSGEKYDAASLFEQTIKALLAFQRRVAARSRDWQEPLGKRARLQVQARAIMEVVMLRQTLRRAHKHQDVVPAVARIFTPPPAAKEDGVAVGMHSVLKGDAALRYAFAGHTHKACSAPMKGRGAEQQVYLNTGSWVSRLAWPAPGEVTPELVAWLAEPDKEHIPFREVPPRCVFAVVNATLGEPSSASLRVWDGGSCNPCEKELFCSNIDV